MRYERVFAFGERRALRFCKQNRVRSECRGVHITRTTALRYEESGKDGTADMPRMLWRKGASHFAA